MYNTFLSQQFPPLCHHGQAHGRAGFLYCCLTSDSDNVVQALAPKYFNTRFLRVFVENVPFLVEKLGLKVLPCVISFVKGVSKDRYVQWLANARILCILTLHAGLLASKNLAMWML